MDYQEAMEKHKKDCRRCREKIYKHAIKKFSCLQEIDIKAYEELMSYRRIGTLEEVREAVEKFGQNVGVWIPCNERLPENAKHKGTFCPKYWVMTKYGQTIGWYNPDFESWFVLVWFTTSRYLDSEIDFDRADIPKVVKVPIKTEIVKAWMPLPEPYRPDLGDEE